MLIEPFDLAGVRIERECRVRVERGAVGAANGSRPRLGLCGAPVAEIRSCVVAAGDPRIAAGTEREREIAPGVATGFAWPCDRRRSPQLLAGRRVMPADEAHIVFVAPASGD